MFFKFSSGNSIAHLFHALHLRVLPATEFQVLHFGYVGPEASVDSGTEGAKENPNIV